MKYNLDAMDNNEKIPYDNQPIYRQQNNQRKKKQDAKPATPKFLSLVVCLLFVLNIVLCGLVINLSKKLDVSPNVNNITITPNGSLNVSAVASKARPSVVAIRLRTGASDEPSSDDSVNANNFYSLRTCGSGVIIKDNKSEGTCYILTCNHVVKNRNITVGAQKQEVAIWVMFSDSLNPVKATLYNNSSYSKMYDIAVLKVERSQEYKNSASKPAEIGDSSILITGDAVVAYGNPQGFGLSVSSGVVSKPIHVTTVDGINNRVMVITAPINGGNSGGGLFDAEGKLVGIVNAKLSGSSIDNIAYAIPVDVAYSLAGNIMRNNGKPCKSETGLVFAMENTNIVEELVDGKLLPRQSIVVSEVEVGSAGELAGFKVGDVITSFNYGESEDQLLDDDVVMRNLYSLENHIFNIDKGDIIVFNIKRGSSEKRLVLNVSSWVAVDSKDWYK